MVVGVAWKEVDIFHKHFGNRGSIFWLTDMGNEMEGFWLEQFSGYRNKIKIAYFLNSF